MTKMWGVKAYRRYILWEKSKDSRKHGSHRKYRLARNYRVLGSGARCTGAAVEIPVSVVSNGADKYNGAIDKSESRCSILTALGFSWLLFTPPPLSLSPYISATLCIYNGKGDPQISILHGRGCCACIDLYDDTFTTSWSDPRVSYFFPCYIPLHFVLPSNQLGGRCNASYSVAGRVRAATAVWLLLPTWWLLSMRRTTASRQVEKLGHIPELCCNGSQPRWRDTRQQSRGSAVPQ